VKYFKSCGSANVWRTAFAVHWQQGSGAGHQNFYGWGECPCFHPLRTSAARSKMADVSPPFSPRGIDHVVLLVDDMDRATGFYTDVIGCSVENDLPQYGMRQVRVGEHLIDLVDISKAEGEWARPEVAGGRNVDHVAISIGPADPQEVRDHLAEHAVEIEEEGDNIGALGRSLSLYVRDPAGNQIELSFPPGSR
jgi:catechol 2,3-dioxygenase-like lactoylglutathione lyase family enzyme